VFPGSQGLDFYILRLFRGTSGFKRLELWQQVTNQCQLVMYYCLFVAYILQVFPFEYLLPIASVQFATCDAASHHQIVSDLPHVCAFFFS
jgi:hypothetical protein